ncbi:IgA Peptidase M64 [Prevotellaceae bacterium HUN156]|nr:IgA Peptidase M64 [Prevotellaceae bacterium HUN156]
MRKRKLLLYFLALFPLVLVAQNQHVSILQTTGDSIQYDLAWTSGLKPEVKDGKVVWNFKENKYLDGDWKVITSFSLDNVKSIDFKTFEYDEKVVRKALKEFYEEKKGDTWRRKDNWCSDEPIWLWYGLNGHVDPYGHENHVPWVETMWLNCTPNNISTPGPIPDCLQKWGPIRSLNMVSSAFTGEIPEYLANIYSLQLISLDGNNLTGTIPPRLSKLPHLGTFTFYGNKLSGPLPESVILDCMNNKEIPPSNFDVSNNYFSGKVPASIQNHPRFMDFWPNIVIQNTPLDISDLVIPAPDFTTLDVYGNTLSLPEIYKKNKYTLLYKWGLWCSYSEGFNKILIPFYKAYKEKGFEVVGIHYDLSYSDDGLLDYMTTHEIPWNNTIYKDWGELRECGTQIFKIGGVPQVFLVDQNGHIVFNSLMDDEGNNQIPNGYYRENVFKYIEDNLGPADYLYTSTDYSKDGEVTVLQTATQGTGIDLVFVGEGFTDKAIEEGDFERRMEQALRVFFSYEPYKSLRDRFNVYAVKTVSPNAEFIGNAKHAIDEDISKALEYASKVTTLIPNRPMRVNVIYNNDSHGRSHCTMMADNSYVCFSMDGVSDVLVHEAGGHGIGHFFDEYVEPGNEELSLPEEKKEELENFWTTLGWGANVDWRSAPTEVKWAKFINDERYADEGIGVYEGAYLYASGAYRATENSMMRYNDVPFNAPCREEIYKLVMKESEGESWIYNYEDFVAFDEYGHNQYVQAIISASRRASVVEREYRTAPPVFLNGTWRDALKKK